MSERKISAPDLQKLFEEIGVTWGIEEGRNNIPLIRVTCPIPPDLNALSTSCQACGALARVALRDEEFPYPDTGVIIKFENLTQYQVAPDCDADDDNCILNQDPRFFERKVMGGFLAYAIRLLHANNIHPHPPTIEELQKAVLE